MGTIIFYSSKEDGQDLIQRLPEARLNIINSVIIQGLIESWNFFHGFPVCIPLQSCSTGCYGMQILNSCIHYKLLFAKIRTTDCV